MYLCFLFKPNLTLRARTRPRVTMALYNQDHGWLDAVDVAPLTRLSASEEEKFILMSRSGNVQSLLSRAI